MVEDDHSSIFLGGSFASIDANAIPTAKGNVDPEEFEALPDDRAHNDEVPRIQARKTETTSRSTGY